MVHDLSWEHFLASLWISLSWWCSSSFMLLQHQLSAQGWIYCRNFLFTCSTYKSRFKVNSQVLISDGKLLQIHYNQIIILNWKKKFLSFWEKQRMSSCQRSLFLSGGISTSAIDITFHSLGGFPLNPCHGYSYSFRSNSFLASYFYYLPYNGAPKLAFSSFIQKLPFRE